ncbi:MAG: 16S rRNA (guanine(527)-N(7))-methyltransferase RsmG [Anaerolineaceae bacterium]|nr:16S rRNA (guanine(527)-N(7))-methyltransferase RsmG [Anaerolineaceae bacterium]
MEFFRQTVQSMLGLRLSTFQMDLFTRYETELLEWNARFNLTAIREPEGIRTKHFLDSLTCLIAFRDAPPGRLIDIGTGAGFPGIPLKIVIPGLRLTLVESVGKKAVFCRHVVQSLKLDGVEVVQARAEEVGQMSAHRERYDWSVARAVASFPVLVEYLLPLVKVGGHALAQKGEGGPAEAHGSERALKLLGGRLKQLIPVQLPGVVEDRYLLVVDKVAATPSQYPRRPGVPAKTPLASLPPV